MQQARKNQFYIQPPASSKLSRFMTFYRRISQILRAHNMLTMFILSTGKIPKWSVKRKHLAREMSVYQNQDIYQLSETSLFTVKKKWWKSPLNHIPVPKMHTLIHRRDILLFPCSFCRFFTTSGKLGANVGRPAGVRYRRLALLAVDMWVRTVWLQQETVHWLRQGQ